MQSSSKMVKNLDDLFREHLNRTHDLQSHTMWRCNRMEPARALRQLFPRPSRLPANGIALERFLAIDTIGAPPYPMPDTECSNMFAIQVAGVRTVVLRPTSECRHKCRTVSVRLPPSYVCKFSIVFPLFNNSCNNLYISYSAIRLVVLEARISA